jgi:hypothetical protein
MKKLALTAALGASCLALAACGDRNTNTADANDVAANDVSATGEAVDANAGTAATASAAAFPKDARIVEENGVTYRVDASGARVALGPNDSRIVVEKGVRYRVDPDGTRVRLDPKGLAIDLPHVDLTPDVDLPDVDVGINNKGHPDVDVKDKGDGDKGPN